jgi:hypothetical protein
MALADHLGLSRMTEEEWKISRAIAPPAAGARRSLCAATDRGFRRARHRFAGATR